MNRKFMKKLDDSKRKNLIKKERNNQQKTKNQEKVLVKAIKDSNLNLKKSKFKNTLQNLGNHCLKFHGIYNKNHSLLKPQYPKLKLQKVIKSENSNN